MFILYYYIFCADNFNMICAKLFMCVQEDKTEWVSEIRSNHYNKFRIVTSEFKSAFRTRRTFS